MPVQIRINTVAGSNESAVDLGGAILLDSGVVLAGAYQWELLDWPTGSRYDQSVVNSSRFCISRQFYY